MIGTKKELMRYLLDLPDDNKRFEVKQYREQRTNKENRYFHRLVGLLAKGEEIRFYTKKNELIRQYGNHEYLYHGEAPAWEILPDNDNWMWHEVKHYVPTEYVGEVHGVAVRVFLLLKGTSTYDTAEMAQLIKATREECAGCGIPWSAIETPEERRLMMELEKYEEANQSIADHKRSEAPCVAS